MRVLSKACLSQCKEKAVLHKTGISEASTGEFKSKQRRAAGAGEGQKREEAGLRFDMNISAKSKLMADIACICPVS